MLKQLYEKFQNWCENNSIFIYSDPHFVGKGMIDSDEVKVRKASEYA